MAKPTLGTGQRFAALVEKLTRGGKSKKSAQRIAAYIGRKKYGKKKFQELAAKGRRRKK